MSTMNISLADSLKEFVDEQVSERGPLALNALLFSVTVRAKRDIRLCALLLRVETAPDLRCRPS